MILFEFRGVVGARRWKPSKKSCVEQQPVLVGRRKRVGFQHGEVVVTPSQSQARTDCRNEEESDADIKSMLVNTPLSISPTPTSLLLYRLVVALHRGSRS